jgi:hypothetical protein
MHFFAVEKKRVVVILLIGVVAVWILTALTPPLTNPPSTREFDGPDSVQRILKHACYDCHSNNTKLEWYHQVAPLSWKISADVMQARKHLNFSHWDSLSAAEQRSKVWYAVNMIEQRKMPRRDYTLLHPSAKLTEREVNVLKNYIVTLTNASAAQSKKQMPTPVSVQHTSGESPNGIQYFSDYLKWKVIVATNRFDNGTMRIIYGNDIAIKAIQSGNINPWPNGAVIVKVVWDKGEQDADGNIYPGDFNNVQFMIRDEERFQKTEGWGFARFSTSQLVPYGKDVSFEVDCMNCHRLASANGFVFDIPTKKR